ncbi:hypothetical protein JZ751_000454 [Albula glossodonta]|uniref:Microtubule-actin cross-linking factor 1-like n=1 Tax=Albula glossodonta TaxID=121402 RepID=A0A8T2PWM3_9TELE|nr:hypothetical protein JZ751_000454 [Albula glossodonta]
MGKPLSRPDCLRQNPRCLGKGEDEEGYIEDCYVPQRSIYDTMRINEQIDQGTKLSQPSRSTLGSGGGEGSTLSSNGTLGADVGGVFVARPGDSGARKLDERVIFDALKLTGEPQSKLPAVVGGSASAAAPSSSSASGVAAAVTKRRHQGGDRKDNPNRRSWKAFMPPSYPEFAERLELSPGDSAEKRLSGAGIPLSPLLPLPSLLPPPAPSSTPPLPPSYSASPASSGGPRTPPVSCSPSQVLTPLPPHQQHPLRQKQPLFPHPLLLKQHKQTSGLPSPSKEQPLLLKPTFAPIQQDSVNLPQHSGDIPKEAERKRDERKGPVVPPTIHIKEPEQELSKDCEIIAAKAADAEQESPTIEQDHGTTPLLPPKPVFCPPTKARTWPRSMRGGKRSSIQGGSMLHNLPALPPLPPLIGEDSDLDEESLYLLDPPSPFLQDGEGLGYGGLPLSPCLSQEGGEEGLLGWPPQAGGLRERTASELRFEEDERRILQELEEEEEVEEEEQQQEECSMEQKEREQREERTWEAVLKLENREKGGNHLEGVPAEPHLNPGSSGNWPLLTPPSGFGGSEPPSVSPCPSSAPSSDDLFLELERQCLEEEEGDVPLDLHPKNLPVAAECPESGHVLPGQEDECREVPVDLEPTEPLDFADSAKNPNLDITQPSIEHLDQGQVQSTLEQSDLDETQTCLKLAALAQTQSCTEELVSGQATDILPHLSLGETQPCLRPMPEAEEGLTEVVEEADEAEEQNSHAAENESTGGLVSDWARESDSSGIHMSNLDPTAPSDTGSELERPETDSDLGSGASLDGEGGEEEKVGEEQLEEWQISPPLSTPCPENPYADGQEGECEEPSLEQGNVEDEGMRTEVSSPHSACEEEFVSASEVTAEMTSDLVRTPQLMGANEGDASTGLVPKGVGDDQCQEQRITSTPKSDSPHPRIDAPPSNASSSPPSPLPTSPSKHEVQGAGLDNKVADAFVPTDSFVYLAVSAPPQFPQDCPPSPLGESAPPSPLPKLCPEPEEGAFLSSDSFVYLAAPERLPLAREGCSTCGDSDSEGSRSGVDFVLGSTTGDSDWDSDGLEPEPVPSQPSSDQWEQLDPTFLQGLFGEMCAELGPQEIDALENMGADPAPQRAEQEVLPVLCPDSETKAEALEREQVDSIQPKLQQVNAVGQGLIQSAAKHTDTQALEHDLDTTNLRWNSLNKRVAERIAQLQEALLHCGKFQDALEPLLSWLSDTEELIANQKPPSAEYRVVKAQIQEQKLLQRLLDDRRGTVEMIRAEEWLSSTERRLSTAEPMGTQTAKITQQITRHKALQEEVSSRGVEVKHLEALGQSLSPLSCAADRDWLGERVGAVRNGHTELQVWCERRAAMLEQALANAQLFGEEEVEVLNWLAEVAQRLAEVSVQSYQPDQLAQQHKYTLSLNEEIVSRKKTVDQAIKNGQALLKQTTGEEVLLIQEKLDGIKSQKRLVLDTVNEVGSALLDLVPWRAREGLDRLVADANQRYRQADETITQRVQLVQAAIQRSQQYEEAVDAELTWVGETERKLGSLGPLSLEPDVTVAQLQVQRAFNIDIIRHKDTIDQLLKTRDEILETCSDQQKEALKVKTNSLSARYEAVSQSHSERFSALEQAQVLVARFWETYEELEPWLGETETLIAQLPPPAIDTEALRQQQDQMRLLRESIAEHKPHIDKLLKIGPQLAELSAQEGATVRQRYSEAEKRYLAIKEEVKGRATALDEAVSQSAQLDKLLPSFSALCTRGEELITRASHDDPAAQAVRSRLLRLRSLWDEIRQRAEERESKLQDVLDLAGKFWADMAALLSTLRDSQDIVKDLEDPGVDPSLIKQQIEAAEAIKAETDGLREELEFVRTLGADLIFACGETEKPEVKKTIDEGMFDYLDNAVIKLCDMPAVGTDLSTVKQQIEELKQFKVEVYQQQIDMEKLCHQGELLLKKVSDQTDQDMIQEPLTELRHLWENLGDKITHRQHKLEAALLALGQFQHALSELQSWLRHTHTTLDTQRPVSSDPKAIEIELAKHHVLRNDVLSHRSTVETVNNAGSELLESSPGDEASHLRDQLDELNRSWESLLLKTQERQKLLEAALQQAEGFHGELEEFLQWLRRTESQLSAAKPTGGLPETAREQLQQHMELQAQLAQRAEPYHRLLDQGESMLLSRGGEEGGPGATQTQQNLALLQNKWASLNTKMDDRRAKLEEAVALATGFQSSLQDTINWLTQAEQTLNMAQPPSLILDTVLFQIDEHKVFVNEVNTHREQVLALEKAGSQLRFASLKQDVVLIKNLLLSVQARWDKLVQRSLDRGRHLDEARKRAKQFHEAWRKLTDWLEEAESRLDSELEISNEPDKIKVQLAKHKEFQKALGSKQPVYDTTVRSGRAMRDKATLPADTQKLDNLLGEVRDKWDTVCGKSVERQHKLEEALLFSGQFAEALQALVDWLYRVEPQLSEDQPVHGDLDLVSNLMDCHKAFQKELGKRTSSVQALKRSARELMETGRDDTAWVRVQLQELSNRWDTVCALSVTKQTRLQQALKQAEEFRSAVQMLLEWLSEAEQTLRFRGVLPEEVETLQALLHSHREFMQTVEEKRVDVNKAAGLGEAILAVCHPDCITTIKHWITIIRARFEEVLTWAKQHEQRLEGALTELLNNATLLEELLSWLQWAETTLVQRDTEPLPQDIPQLKTLITEHQVFMEEMTRKQPDVDRLKEFANFDFDVWRKKYMRWMNHKKSRVMDFFRRIDKDQDGKITRQEFIDGILASKFPTSKLEMTAVADIFDRDGDGYIDYYEFVAALHPNKDAYRPTTDADKIEDEVTRQVAQCKCAKRFQVEQIGENKYRFGDSQQLRLVRILRSTVMVRVGGGWMALDEFLVKNDPCRVHHPGVKILRSESSSSISSRIARGRTNLELREKFILPEGASQGLAAFRSRGRRSKPSSRTASPTRSSSSASHSAHSCASLPSAPATPTASSRSTHTHSRGYAKPWLAHSKTPTPTKSQSCPEHSQTPGPEGASSSKLKRPTFHSSRGSLTGENGGQGMPSGVKPGRPDSSTKRTPSSASGPASRAGSRAGSRASSRRGSDASDASELLETRSACSDTSDTPRRPGAKPSKIPTISKKAPSPKTTTSKR